MSTEHTVKATREGLQGHRTASGYIIDEVVSFVALPASHALHRFISVTNPLTAKTTLAQVLDVGPFLTDDLAYVFGTARPASEGGQSVSGLGTNRAGIDLGGYVWRVLGMVDNTDVTWSFAD